MKNIITVITVIVFFSLFSCGTKRRDDARPQGDSIHLSYANRLSIVKFKDYDAVTIQNPWDTTKILHTYYLVSKDKEVPTEIKGKGTLVRTPLSKAVIYSSVHCSLLNDLGAFSSIGGVCDLNYIKLDKVHQGYEKGEIADIGSGMNPNIEKLIDLSPDAILLSPFENSGGYGRVEKLNIPIIECADYMETSAMGRAEWMKFYGLLFGKYDEACKMFNQVDKEYVDLKKLTEGLENRPTVFSELKSGSAWYVAGGRSIIGQLYADAGADYIWADDKHSGSIPLAFEVVFDKASHADFWLIKYNQKVDKSYSELKKDYRTYAHFDAFKNRQIFGCNTNKISFYEDTPFNPQYILKDFIKIFHPELLKDYNLRFFSNLAE